MELLKKYMLPLLALALLVSFVESFRSFFMAIIIQPIALVCWAVWRILSSVDQGIYWMILIAVCLILILRLIPSGNVGRSNLSYEYTYRARNRVDYWEALMEDAVGGKEETENLRDNLKKLFLSVVAHSEAAGPGDLENTMESENVSLSPRARRFLWPPRGPSKMFSQGVPFNTLFFVPGWLRKWTVKLIPQDVTAMNEILEWMESELEIDHDQ